MSLGGSYTMMSEQQAYQRYFDDDSILFIAAAGNDGTTGYSYPASYSAVMSVGATDSSDTRAYFSQYNDQVDIAAPGVNIESTYGAPRGTEPPPFSPPAHTAVIGD